MIKTHHGCDWQTPHCFQKMTCLRVTQKSNFSNFNSNYNTDPICQNPQKTSMLRFLTTIKVITTKQRNKFKSNNREGGDKRAEKAPFPTGTRKQQEPVSLWQHLQTFLLLSQKYLMLMLQRDASAAASSQHTFNLASSRLPEKKEEKKTTVFQLTVLDICHDRNTPREGKKRGVRAGRGRGKWRSGRRWSMCENVCVNKIIWHSLGLLPVEFFFFFLMWHGVFARRGGGFLLLSH